MESLQYALERELEPIRRWLDDENVSEILINQMGCLWIERQSGFEKITHPSINKNFLWGITQLIANDNQQELNHKKPLLSAQLEGHRIQIVAEPATRQSTYILSIRKQVIQQFDLMDYEQLGAFERTRASCLEFPFKKPDSDTTLIELFKKNQWIKFLTQAVCKRKTILISGATSTGKTTFLNACLRAIPLNEHLITIEDVAEIKPPHELHTSLLVSKGNQGISTHTIQDLIQASLRLRPDRIILGELRGAEAADFIHAISCGHDGSLSSIHASSPLSAFIRLTHMVKLSGIQLSREDILHDLVHHIDIVVHLQRRFNQEGTLIRGVTEIYYAC